MNRVAIAVAGLVAFALGLSGVHCLDVWMHLRTGAFILETGHIPTQDVLSHTRVGGPWVTHEWAFEVPLYGVWRLGGDASMVLVQAGLAGLAFAMVTVAGIRAGAPPGAAAVAAILGAWLGWPRFLPRPHMASAVLTATVLAAGFALRERPTARWRWALVPTFALWANLHSGVVVGLGVLGAFALEEAVRARRLGPLVPLWLASAAATMLNPHGWRALWYPFWLVLANDRGAFDILELRPPGWPDLVHGAAALTLVVGGLGARRLGLAGGIVAVTGLVLGLTRVRGSLDLAIMVAPAVALGLGAIAAPIARRVQVPGWATAAVLGVALLAGSGWRPTLAVDGRAIPAAAMQYVNRAGLGGKMLNAHGFGAWLIWAHPEHPVFFDGRNEVFEDLFVEARDTSIDVLSERYDLGFAVLDYPSDDELAEVEIAVELTDLLVAHPGWALVWFDDVARVYARRRAENDAVIARDAYTLLRPGWTDFAYILPAVQDAELAARFEAEARRAVAEAPAALQPRTHFVEFLRLSGRAAEALAELDQMPPGVPFAVGRRGALLLQLGRDAEAVTALEAAVALEPDNATHASNLGLARLRQGDAAGAATALRRAVELDAELVAAWRNLAMALQQAGDPDDAAEARSRADQVTLELARRHGKAGEELFRGGFMEKAIVELSRAAELSPRDPAAHFWLGAAYNEVNDPVRAERALRTVQALSPGTVDTLYELGKALQAQGRDAEAAAAYDAYISRTSDARLRDRALQRRSALSLAE